jgi:hypothetical protein
MSSETEYACLVFLGYGVTVHEER